MDEFVEQVDKKQPPAPEDKLAAFEIQLGQRLPQDYREFLRRTNGGFIGGRYWFMGPTPDGDTADAGVHHIGGFREERHFSLESDCRTLSEYIPDGLIPIMDDPFGNQICLGIKGEHRGRVFFWDHENQPDESEWDRRVETAGNVKLLANSFTDFVAGLCTPDDE